MSRIHDALRRGRSPAGSSPAGRTANADAVLTALGYRSDRPRRRNAGLLLGTIVFALAAVGIWWMVPGAVSSKAPAPPRTTPRQDLASKSSTPHETGRKGAGSALPSTKPVVTKPSEAKPVESKPSEARQVKTKPPETRVAERLPASAAREGPTLARGPVAQRAVPAPPKEVPASPKTGAVTPKAPAAAEPESAASGSRPPKADDLRLALYYQRAGDFEQALVHYKAVLQRDELNVDAHNNLGNLYMGKGLFEEAAREFRHVVAIEPRYVTAHVNLSAALYQLRRYDESAAEARTAIHLDARNGDAFVNLALSQAASGQPGEARASLTRALEIDKHNAAAHYNLALQYEKAGEVALALDHYRAFLQYAAPEQAGYAADVRSRVRALESKRDPGTPNREPRNDL